MHLYGKKHLKILFSKTEDALWLNLCIYYWEISACLQWLCHSGEQTVARGPLVIHSAWQSLRKANYFVNPVTIIIPAAEILIYCLFFEENEVGDFM